VEDMPWYYPELDPDLKEALEQHDFICSNENQRIKFITS